PARNLPVDEDAMPDRDLHQSPERPAGVAARLLLAHERGDAVGAEPAPDGGVPGQMRGELIEERAVEPQAHRDREAALPSPQMRWGKVALGPAPLEQLAVAEVDLERIGECQAELDDAMVDEWHPAFEAGGHQDAIRLDQE